jgi:hypothetical protein
MSTSTTGGFAAQGKLEASSQRVRAACRAICAMLEAEGLHLSQHKRRDGFTYESGEGFAVPIDPKIETLRIKIGLSPTVPPPRELVHQGTQRDWIVVDPEHAKVAEDYLRHLVRSRRR